MIEKLQKLIAHERSARAIGNIAEAEAFAAKIQHLLVCHKLSMSEVEIAAEERDQPVSQETVEGAVSAWLGVVAMGCGAASFCKVLKSHNGYIFIGRPDNRQTAITMFHYLSVTGKSLADDAAIKYKCSDEGIYATAFRPGAIRSWRNSFLLGYSSALYNRLESERKTITDQARGVGTGLIYIDKNAAAIDSYCSAKWGKLGKGRRSTSKIHAGAWGAGRVAGSNVSTAARAQLSS
jgi:hypothetical protein